MSPVAAMTQTAIREATLRIEGMHCGSCIRRVAQVIASAGQVTVKEVRLGAARFVGSSEEETASAQVSAVALALAKAGFKASLDEE